LRMQAGNFVLKLKLQDRIQNFHTKEATIEPVLYFVVVFNCIRGCSLHIQSFRKILQYPPFIHIYGQISSDLTITMQEVNLVMVKVTNYLLAL
jgi:hypothetical protein